MSKIGSTSKKLTTYSYRVKHRCIWCTLSIGKHLEYITHYLVLGNKMLSKEMEKDLETLLSMEIKLRLLDAEGVDIPQDPPPIPEDPPNYDFCYELK